MRLIPVSQLQVSPNRQRRTFTPARLHELRESIETHGLFHPLVVRPEGDHYVLVAGERRLRAITDLRTLGGVLRHDAAEVPGDEVPVVLLGELDPLQRELAELAENVDREDLPWQERAAALARINALRAELATAAGEQPPSVAELAEEFFAPVRDGYTGDSRYAVEATRQQLVVAKHLDNPEVAKAKTVGEAFKVLKRQEQTRKHAELAEKVGAVLTHASHEVRQVDSLIWLTEAPAETFDIILTDPPYGMGADGFGDSAGKVHGEHGYEDSEDVFQACLEVCAAEFIRIAKPQAHLYWFCDIDKFYDSRGAFALAGWWVHRTPLVWSKPAATRVPWPEHGPRRTYELILYAVKGKRPLNMIAPDVLTFNPEANLGHSAQKPVALFEELLKRSARPGDKVLDAFAGTGTILPAAHKMKCMATALERDPASYGIALKRLEALK